jgi:hypothetical protein
MQIRCAEGEGHYLGRLAGLDCSSFWRFFSKNGGFYKIIQKGKRRPRPREGQGPRTFLERNIYFRDC